MLTVACWGRRLGAQKSLVFLRTPSTKLGLVTQESPRACRADANQWNHLIVLGQGKPNVGYWGKVFGERPVKFLDVKMV